MNKKRIVALATSAIMVATLFAGCGSTGNTTSSSTSDKKKTSVKIGLVTDKGGRGDKSFNDAACLGLTNIQNQYTVTPQILESKAETDYEPFLTQIAQNNDLTFAIGFAMQDAVTKVSKANPTKKFCIIDQEVSLDNVVSVEFKAEQSSFLMGIIAAKTSKTGHIGFIGGINIPLINAFQAGFIAGVKSINPTAADELVKSNSIYVGDFGKPDLGKEAAKTLFGKGCDVIYHAAGSSGLGLLDEAHEERAAGKKVWAIGVDQDQSKTVPADADAILSSAIKRVDTAVYDVSKSAIDGSFKGKTNIVLGLKENGVGMADSTSKNTAKDVVDLANKYKEAIVSGKITVPTTVKDAQNFTPVQP